MLRVRRHHLRRLARPVAVAICCAAYLVTSLGYPVASRPARSSSGWFPCASRACGCSTAEQCRRACCCSKTAPVAPEPQKQPACEGGEGHSCCAKAKPPAPKPKPIKVRFVLGADANRCQGLTLTWVAGGVTLPAPPAALCLPLDESRDARPLFVDGTEGVGRGRPPSPPPRPA